MKILLLFFLSTVTLVLTLNSQKQYKVEILKFPNADHFLMCNEKRDSSFSGSDTLYSFDYKDEKINIILYFEKGKKTKAIAYYDKGIKCRETNFNGVGRHGIDIEWYKNGNIEYMCYFDNNISKSPMLAWHKNGVLARSIIDFSSFKYMLKAWSERGVLIKEVTPIDSSKEGAIVRKYYENGQLQSLSYCSIGKQPYIAYYDNGKKEQEGLMFNVEILRLGKWTYWYENGKKAREESYSEDDPLVKDGVWKWWDKNGNVVNEEIYKNGVLIKKSLVPYKND